MDVQDLLEKQASGCDWLLLNIKLGIMNGSIESR